MQKAVSQGKAINIVIVDDHQVVLDGFLARLEMEDEINVVATASNGAEAIDAVTRVRPDVVLMDVSMPVMNGIEATMMCRDNKVCP
ncbi:Transcriptional regulator (fragment) [Vibrio nigripulchritudo SFn27]